MATAALVVAKAKQAARAGSGYAAVVAKIALAPFATLLRTSWDNNRSCMHFGARSAGGHGVAFEGRNKRSDHLHKMEFSRSSQSVLLSGAAN